MALIIKDTILNMFNFKAAISRKAFICEGMIVCDLFMLTVIGIKFVLVALIKPSLAAIPVIGTVLLFLAFVSLFVLISISVRRCHDAGLSGYQALWWLVPVLGFAVVLYYCLQPTKDCGTKNEPSIKCKNIATLFAFTVIIFLVFFVVGALEFVSLIAFAWDMFEIILYSVLKGAL